MPGFAPALAAIRFGLGRSPSHPDPVSAAAMLAALDAPDALARRFPIDGIAAMRPRVEAFRALQKARSEGRATPAEFNAWTQENNQTERLIWSASLGASFARGIAAPDGFRDRLTLFWADHFATAGRGPLLQRRVDTYVDEAIRPHVAGRFGDLLKAAVLHPVMLAYLEQDISIGPGSPAAAEGKGRKGLNENLAREILELHTLGVQGGYSQDDVRQMAELLAGVTMTPMLETAYAPRRSEPGAEHVLDFATPERPAGRMAEVHQALDYLATHPATAAHLARKLAVHFVSDDPEPDLVAAMAARHRDTGGDLAAVYDTMLGHPGAWDPALVKVKRPVDFLISALRAVDADPQAVAELARDEQKARFWLANPMEFMGQSWGAPAGPNGWPEEGAAWITANTLAVRMQWAFRVPAMPGVPKETQPVALARAALGPYADDTLIFAAGASESRAQGVGLVLVSPAFQRR